MVVWSNGMEYFVWTFFFMKEKFTGSLDLRLILGKISDEIKLIGGIRSGDAYLLF